MSQYLSEDIKQPIVHSPPGSPRNVYLLKAPTGSGKTTFFIKDLVPEARRRGQAVLLIVNRCVLTDQLINIYLKELGIPHPKSCWESLQAGTISPVSSGLNLVPTPSLCSKVLVRFRFGLMNNWPEPIRTPTT